MTAQRNGLSLDRSGEPWVGQFPGLGTVHIHADGSVDVVAEPDHSERAEEIALRRDALRYGWAEPLSLVRRGYRCAWGTALVSPTGDGCLILRGVLHEVAVVLVELAELGWRVLSDRFVPTSRVEGQLLAFPTDAPVLLSRHIADRSGLSGAEVRAHTNAVAVDLPRATQPSPVSAFVTVGVRRPGEPVIEALTGHDRFRAASSAMAGGVMADGEVDSDGSEPDAALLEYLALASLPFVRLRFERDSLCADIAELSAWMSTTASATPEAAS